MKVIATNIGKRQAITWNGKEETTGMYKTPVKEGIYLGQHDVDYDVVVDRRYHGGEWKACYMYSEIHYSFWREQYPELDANYGLFGENLTIEGLKEDEVFIGAQYKVGEAIVQVSQPRQPCYKLGIRFGDQGVLKTFIDTNYSGVYFKVLEEGKVEVGDKLELIQEGNTELSIKDIYELLYKKTKNEAKLAIALNEDNLPPSCKESIKKRV